MILVVIQIVASSVVIGLQVVKIMRSKLWEKYYAEESVKISNTNAKTLIVFHSVETDAWSFLFRRSL